jgi:VCBS repeat-containing protein
MLSVSTAYVNDNWRLTADNDHSGTLSIGDTVDNFSDDGVGNIQKTYGVDAFGTVTSSTVTGAGPFTGTVPGAGTIAAAIAGTSSGGTVQILAGTYTESVDASASNVTLGIGGGNTAQVVLFGNLTLGSNDTLAVKVNGLSAGSQYDQLLVENGSVSLTNPTLSATVGFTPTQGNQVTPLQRFGTGSLTGTFHYTPTAGFQLTNPTDSFGLVEDHAPVATDDTGSATEASGFFNSTPGQDASGNVLTNDTDADSGIGDTLSVISVRTGASEGAGTAIPLSTPTTTAHGTLTVSGSGSYFYSVNNADPAVQALRQFSDTLTESFNYTVTDLFGATDTGVLTITIHGANDNPVAVDDSALATEAGGIANSTPGVNPSGNVLTNDTDADDNGETKTVVSFRTGNIEGAGTLGVFGTPLQGLHGSLTLAANGAYTYTVNNSDPQVDSLGVGQSLTDSFNYTMQDAASATDTAVLTVTINGADDNPVITSPTNPAISVPENTTAVATLTASDVDSGDVPTFSVTGGADGSKFTVVGGNQLVFLTAPDFENPTDSNLDNIYQVQVTASDGHGGSTALSLNVSVTNTVDASASLDANGNLVVTSSAGQNDSYQLTFSGTTFTLSAFSGGPFFSTIGTGNGTNTLSFDSSSFTGGIIINTGDGDDTLSVDAAVANSGKNLTFNGGAGGMDTLKLIGTTNTLRYNFTNANDGSVNIDPDGPGGSAGTAINYTGLDPINSVVSVSNVELNFTGGAETITVTNAGGGTTSVGSTLGETVTFANPTTSLKLTATNGADTINVTSLAASSPVQISGDSTDDTVNINGAVSLPSNQSLSISNVGSINVGAASSITTSGTGRVLLSADAMSIASTASVSTDTSLGTVTLTTTTAGQTINLGGADAAGQLGLTNTELSRISTGTIVLGDTTAHTGPITVSSAIGVAPSLSLKWLSGPATTLNVNAALATTGINSSVSTTGLAIAKLNADIATGSGGIMGDATSVTVDDNPTGQIQDGIDIAASGATVNVMAGSYNGAVSINKNLQLAGQANSIVTISAGMGTAVNLGAFTIGVSGLRISNFSIAGISVNGGTVTIAGNTIGSTGATGIQINSGAVTVQNNFIQNNATGINVVSGVAGPVAVHTNSFTSINAGSVGLVNNSALAIDAAGNWWGQSHGPTTTPASLNSWGDTAFPSTGQTLGLAVNNTDGGSIAIASWLTDGTDSDSSTNGFQHAAADNTPPGTTITGPAGVLSTTPTVSGTSEPNSLVRLFEGSTFLGQMITNASGSWSFTTSALSLGTHIFTAKGTDVAGNQTTSAPFTTIVATTTIVLASDSAPPPLHPTNPPGTNSDNLTNINRPTISGTTAPFATVQLLEGSTVLGSTVADGLGAWQITPGSTLSDGVHNLFAKSTDSLSNVSLSPLLQVTIDTTISLNTTPDMISGSDTGASNTDNRTQNNIPTFTGTAEAGSYVELLLDGSTVLGAANAASPGGSWSITATTILDGSHTISARVFDVAGNVSVSTALPIVIDTTPPAVSVPDMTTASDTGVSNTDNLTKLPTPTFTGTSEAGASVTLMEGSTTLGSTTADSGGNWTITSSTLSAGMHSIFARSTDVAGNTADSAALAITIDTSPPSVSAPTLFPGSDSGTLDGITNVVTPIFTGTAEQGAKVELLDVTVPSSPVVLGSATPDVGGNWSITASPLTNGTHTLAARATDDAGNVFTNATTLSVTIDTTKPTVSDPHLTAASDTGISTSDNLTNIPTPSVTGTSEPGAKITLLEGTTTLGTTTVDNTGNWTILSSALSEGPHLLFVTAIDAAGNQATSNPLVVTIDTTPPATPSVPVLTAASDTGSSNHDGITKITTPTFTGTAEPGSIITLSEGSTVRGTTTADSSGNWTITSSALTAGVHNLSAQATDAAGNVQPVASAALMIAIDTTPPTVTVPDLAAASDTGTSTTDNITSNKTPTFTGSAEAGATVELLDGSTVVGSGPATGGSWSITTSALSDGVHSITARATDLAGNQTTSAALSVTIDTVAAAPVVTGITTDSGSSATDGITNDTTLTVNGTAEANAVVKVFDGTTQLGTATASAAGAWSFVDSRTLTNGSVHNYNATATDVAGNVSGASNTFVATIDTAAPAAPSVPDLTDASDTGSSNTDNLTKNTSPIFTGTTEPGATVTLLEGTTSRGTGVADSSGVWNITVNTVLATGTHSFSARATDVAGNTGATSGALTITIDTTPPAAPGTPDLATASDSGSSSTDNLTNVTTPTFTGTAAAGTFVELLDGTTVVGSATATSGGAWTIISSALADGVHSIAARASDAAGNASANSTALSVTIDTTPPAVSVPDMSAASDTGSSSTDNITRTTAPVFTGTAQAGLTVQLVEGTTVLGSAVATGGNWSITSSTLAAGVHNVFARATDAAGNQGTSGTLAVTIDLTAPPAPSTPDLTDASDSGASSTDNLTNLTTPTFSGMSEAGATITLLEGTTTRGTTTADSLGNWTVTSSALTAGAHSLTARATDAAGNVGGTSAALSITIDITPPTISPPDMTAASDSGLSSTDNVTNISSPTFTGTAEAGSLVELLDGSTVVGSATATGGNWSITSSPLSDGVHSLTARAIDPAGNQATSTALSVTIDTTNPTISDPDLAAASDSGISNTDNLTNVKTPVFTGTAEAGATVTLLEGSTVLGTATATGGSWTITSASLADGLHSIFAKAMDAAGNQTTSNTLTVTIDTAVPSAPSIPDLAAASDSGSSSSDNITNVTTPTFSGTADANAAITLLEGSTTLGNTTADNLGNWTITSSTLAAGVHNITARATDAAGNQGPASAALSVTIDTVAPSIAMPLLLPANDTGASNTDRITNINTPMLTGSAEAGTFIELFDGPNLVGTTTTPTGGLMVVSWTITTSTLSDGVHTLTARGTDAAGNVGALSAPLTITVDTIPPATPSTPDLDPASDTGDSNTDNLTGIVTPKFNGTADPGVTVQLVEGTTILGTGTADASGNWSITSSMLSSGVHNIAAQSVDIAGNTSTPSAPLAVTISTSFRVVSLVTNASGFDATFSRPPVLSDINLYDGPDAAIDVPDVVLHAVNANTDIHGSLVWNATTNTLSFVKTGGVLAPDTYSVDLRSSATGFHDASGNLLDGNGDLVPGDDFISTFTVADTGARVLSLHDFARGPGQHVDDNPASPGSNLALSIDNASGVRSASFTLQYDPTLLRVNGATLAAGLPADWNVVITASNPTTGQLSVTVSGTTPLSGSGVPLVLINADVPTSAPYNALEVLKLGNAAVNVQSGASVVSTAAVGDYAIHKDTYLGDADGNGIYTGFDSALVARVVVGLDTGFDTHSWTDPVIVADIVGSGKLSGIDTTLIAQKSVNLTTPQIPNLPGIALAPNGGGGSVALDTPQTASATVVSNPAGAAALIVSSSEISSTTTGSVPAAPTGSSMAAFSRATPTLIVPALPQIWAVADSTATGRASPTGMSLNLGNSLTGSAASVDDYFAQLKAEDSTAIEQNSLPAFTTSDEPVDDCFDSSVDDLQPQLME